MIAFEWRTDEPPKDFPILVDVNCPWPVMAMWNPITAKWCCTQLQVGLYNGRYDDWYFENEWVETKNIRKWAMLPSLA